MNHITKYAAALITLSAACAATAQNTQSGYFLDDYTYRFLMNPALAPDSARLFVAIPALGDINTSMRGNTSLTDVIYNVDGRTTTFLNPGVSASEVMGNLHGMNRVGADIRINIVGAGFKAWGGYNTINISARTSVHTRVPKALFSFLKEGISNRTYEIDGFRAKAIGYAEISLGHSRKITPEIRVGANMKFILGVGSVDARLDRATVELGRDSWNITSNATINTSLKGYRYSLSHNDRTDTDYVDGLDGSFKPVNGFGMAFDLGAVYSPKALPDWQFSAGVLDLGFIRWKNNILATTDGDKTFQSSLYHFSADSDAPNSFSDEWDNMRDRIETIYQLDDAGETGGRTQALNATINLGAAYTFPLYRRLKFGLLNTTCIAGQFSWTDFRLSANVNPVKNVSVGINGALGTLGCGFGWIANLRIPKVGLQFFISQDHTFAKLAKQGVPLSANASVSLGFNVVI